MGAKKPTRAGIVLALSRTGTQCRVKWEDATRPQLIHIDYLERADHVPSGTA